MNKLSDFLVAYKALEELYWSGCKEFCVDNPAFDAKSIESRKELMDSHDEKWNEKYSEAKELAQKCGQSEDVKEMIMKMQQWSERLEACKTGSVGKSTLYEGIGTTPNAQPSKKFDDKI